MTEQNSEVLAPITDDDMRRGGLPENMKMAPGLAVYFVDALYQRCKAVALRMSEARGMVGAHLLNNPGACMAIISRSITWNLDPFAVAQSTYMVKDKIGYEGKLCQAILENSGSITGRLEFTFFGDWDKLRGKFKMSGAVGSGERKPQQLWTDEDEVGLGVKVTALVKGEASPREEEFFLAEMQPRNSTLWILRPKQQMRYACARAYGNLAVPGIFMGIPFDVDPSGMGGDAPLDITPAKPQASEFTPERSNPELGDWTAKVNFASSLGDVATLRKEGLAALPPDLHARFEETCDNRARQIGDAPHASQAAGQVQDQDQDRDPREDVPLVGDQVSGAKAEVDAEDDAVEEDARQDTVEDQRPTETPFQRGQRLLAIITVPGDVPELFASVKEELASKKDREVWKGTCEARWKELGGTGKMPLKGVGA